MDALQGSPARVNGFGVVPAIAFVQVLAARRAEAFAIFTAERRGWRREEDLLADGLREIDLLAVIRLFIGRSGIERRFNLFALVMVLAGVRLIGRDPGADQV